MKSLRVHGQSGNAFHHERLGFNGRLDTLQAAILLAKLEIFDEEINLRQEVAERYSRLLRSANGLRTPTVSSDIISSWAQYTVIAADSEHRRRMQTQLNAAGIPSTIYYPLPLHLQQALDQFGYRRGDYPVCEDLCKRVFSLPMHPYLFEEQQREIAKAVNILL
jgi:dTDP-4-amino-4,6-dideoxygalactose transaminase